MSDDRLFRIDDFATPLTTTAPTGKSNNTLNGYLSETRAVAILLERGHKVARPVVDDDGIDLIVNYRHTVQVKSANRSPGGSSWSFGVGQRWKYRANGQRVIWAKPFTADYLICHAVPIDAWWIVPTRWLRETGWVPGRLASLSLSAAPSMRTKYGELSRRCLGSWELFNNDN